MAKPIDGKKSSPEWAKHLRKYGKKQANKSVRRQQKQECKDG